LLEVLVVIAVISIVAGMLAPAIKTAKDKARAAQCVSNMRQFGVAFQMYLDQHNGYMPCNWFDDTYNWQSMLVDAGQGGNYFGNTTNEFLSRMTGPVRIRVSRRLLCPTTVNKAIVVRAGSVVTEQINDPHDQWGYSYNHLRCSISWQADQWPWFDSSKLRSDLRVLYPNGAKYIVMTDGNGANYNPDDWNATTGDYLAFNYPIKPVHGEGVNALFMDGHIQYMGVTTANDIATFNRAFYGGIPIAGNPYLNY
jgi:prepilin-type processing-associated H-X9-DG protein